MPLSDHFPELVHEDSQGTLSVAYGKFSAVLLEAIKEQQASADSTKSELKLLRALLEARDHEVELLRQRVDRIEQNQDPPAALEPRPPPEVRPEQSE